MEKVAIYIRKSRGTDDDLLKHEETLIKLCKSNGWKYDIYKEIGSSQDNEREEYNKLKANITRYKKIVCMNLDRLSREKVEQGELTKLINKYNFTIVTPYRSYTKEDDLIMDIQELIARQEYKLIRTRQIQGTKTSFEKGNWVGGIPTIGYKYDRNKRELIIDNDNVHIYNFIKELALEGNNASMIVKELHKAGYKTLKGNDFHPQSVNRILKCKTYLGYVPYSGEWRKGNHKSLVSQEEWDKIQDFINNRRIGKRSRNNIFPLTGLIKCGQCGALYSSTRRKQRENKEYLKKCWKVNYSTGEKCSNKGVVAEKVHRAILEDLKKRTFKLKSQIDNFDKLTYKKMKTKINLNIKKYSKDIEIIKNKNKNILEMCENGLYEVKKAKEKISNNENEILRLNNLIAKLSRELENIGDKDLKVDLKKTKEVIKILNGLDINDERNDIKINRIYKNIIDYIEMTLTDEIQNLDIYYK